MDCDVNMDDKEVRLIPFIIICSKMDLDVIDERSILFILFICSRMGYNVQMNETDILSFLYLLL